MKEKITKAEFINTWASEWDEITGWKVSEEYHKQFSEQLESIINQEVEKRIAERMPSFDDLDARLTEYLVGILDSVDFHEWLCSRPTPQVPPQDTHQVQKEGGEG